MAQSFTERARSYLVQSQKVLEAAAENEQFLTQMVAVSDAIVNCFKAGGKLLLAGNGGSAGDAQHIAGEFLSRLNFDRAPLPAIALTVDTSVLTAVGNDYGYEQVFERQVHGLGRPGDVFIGISTSGRSPNILRALRKAREMGLITVGFCGARKTEMLELCDIALQAPSESTPHIQQIHITAAHIVCGEVERVLFQEKLHFASTQLVSGASGGGFMMFMTTPENRLMLVEALSGNNTRASPVKFTSLGCDAWQALKG